VARLFCRHRSSISATVISSASPGASISREAGGMEEPERDPERYQTPLRRFQPAAVPALAFSREAGSFGL
jgi:hypothetical protein